ncbi:MAG: Fe-S cluster assembly protein SufD [Acidobacteria bacterium]|nr:MAG: Fe-S cluster assembly protein SufD [Acidobacteriota bacterium]
MPLFGLQDATSGVLANYEARFTGQDPRPAWLHELRQQAFARFCEMGFPHHKMEGWRQTNTAPIALSSFESQPPLPPTQLVPRVRGLDLPGVDWGANALRLVFVNGVFAPGLSSTRLPAGCRMGSLGERFASDGLDLRPYLDYEDEHGQAFVALNTSFLADGAWIEIAPKAVVEQPISILYFTTGSQERKGIAHPRTVVLAGRESQCSVIETCAGADGDVYFTNAVTAFEIAANAQVEYTRMEQESRSAFHISKLRSRQGRDSRFTAHSIALGGSLVRNNVHCILDGEGAECMLNGLFAIDGKQHVDNSTVLDHAKPLGTSREYYKGVLDNQAAGIFNGRIIVRPDAQHTDAIQSSKNLLLSEGAATINAQPQLEIYADDVRCTHGATVGQLDAQALFYLRSRGMGLEESRKLLIYAFAADVLSRIHAPGLKETLEALLWKKWAE